MKVEQTVKIEGADIVVRLFQHPGRVPMGEPRIYKGCAQYVKGFRQLPNGNRVLVMELPERAGLNIKPGGQT